MAITNQERVGKAVDLLRAGLAPYVEREFANAHKDNSLAEARRLLPAEDRINGTRPIGQWDAAILLKSMSGHDAKECYGASSVANAGNDVG